MPKKTDPPMSQAEQSLRFEEAARAIEADGGLSHDEASAAMDRLVRQQRAIVADHGRETPEK